MNNLTKLYKYVEETVVSINNYTIFGYNSMINNLKRRFKKHTALLSVNIPNENIDLFEYLLTNEKIIHNCLNSKEKINKLIFIIPYIIHDDKPYLHLAFKLKGDIEFCSNLSQAVDINSIDSYGNTAIYYSQSLKHYELLYKRINMKHVNSNNDTVLHYLIENNADLANKLQNRHINNNNLYITNKQGEDVLSLCVKNSLISLAYIIIERVNIKIYLKWIEHIIINYNEKKVEILKNIINKRNYYQAFIDIILKCMSMEKLSYREIFEITSFIFCRLRTILPNKIIVKLLSTHDENKNTFIHYLCKIRHKKLIDNIINSFPDIKFKQNKYGDYPSDLFIKNKLINKLQCMNSGENIPLINLII